MRYTDVQDNADVVEKASAMLEHVWSSIPEPLMQDSLVEVNAALLSHILELLLAMSNTYEHFNIHPADVVLACDDVEIVQ